MAGSTAPSQTATNVPSPGQQAVENTVVPNILGLAGTSGPQYYPTQTTVGFNPTQTAAQGAAIGAAGQQADTANWATDLAKAIPGMLTTSMALPGYTPPALPLSSNIFSDPGIWNPGFNAGLTQAIEAATRPIFQNLTETALPAIRTTANLTGPYGGSRQGIAEGLAISRANQTAADLGQKMAQDEYNANLQALNQRYGVNIGALLQQAQQGLTARGQDVTARGQDLTSLYQSLGLLPTLQAAQVTPAQTVAGVGDAQQQMEQALLSGDIARWNYNQLLPYTRIQDILGLSGGLGGGSTVATGNVPQSNPAMQALGGAASGAALGAMTPIPGGAAVGAGAGALLPFLFNR